jgi:hypothetical protein
MGFFPTDYRPTSAGTDNNDPSNKQRYFDPGKRLKDGESTTFRLCGLHDTGHVIQGWSYFTTEGRPRRFPSFPSDYASDIGLSWEGKSAGTGEKDKPRYFLSFVGLSKEDDDFLIYTFQRRDLREQLEEVLFLEDYQFLPSGMANFYLTLKRKGVKEQTAYTLTPTLKVPSKVDEKRWAEASASIWLPALYVNGDPFAGKPAEGRPEGLPPTYRDEYGADHEVATAQPEAMPAGW